MRYLPLGILIVCGVGNGLTACSTTPKMPLNQTLAAPSAQAVADVSVTATNAMRWYDIADDLQAVPFKYDQEKLLSEATSTTSSISARSTDALVATVAAALAGATISKTSVNAVDATGKQTSTSTKTDQITPPAVPGPISFTIQAPAAQTSVPDGTSGADAQFRLQTAAALAEEVAIVNKRVSSLPIRVGYRPYFVSVQISLLPKRHGYPYDSTFEISFSEPTGKAVYVMPLLVTDAIEETKEAQLAEVVRQLGAQLSGVAGLGSASAGLQRTLSQMEASQALRPNSLMSVGKVDEHTVRVRLGANRFGGSYEMIPRTHNVAVVVLVPLDTVREKKLAVPGRPNDDPVLVTPLITMATHVFYADAMVFDHQAEAKKAGGAAGDPYSTDNWSPLALPNEEVALPVAYMPVCPRSQDVMMVSGKQGDVDVETTSLIGGNGLSGRRIVAILTTPNLLDGHARKLVASDVRLSSGGLNFVFPGHVSAIEPGPKAKMVRGEIALELFSTHDGEQGVDCAKEGRQYEVSYLVPPRAPAPKAAPKAKAPAGGAPKVAPEAEASAPPDSATKTAPAVVVVPKLPEAATLPFR